MSYAPQNDSCPAPRAYASNPSYILNEPRIGYSMPRSGAQEREES